MIKKYTCDVCGKECTDDTSIVACSAILPISNRYCMKCQSKFLEPYNQLVDFLACSGLHWPDDVNTTYRIYIRQQLKDHGKSEADFACDVENAILLG